MPVIAVSRFEHFFRAAAGLDVDKSDLKRYSDFVNRKLYDMLVVAEAAAKSNRRDVIQPWDLPITKGLQESMHDFRDLDEELDLASILAELAALPPLDLTLSEETEARLPAVSGGLSVALARAIRVMEPARKNPASEEWTRTIRVFDLLL
ncbi:DUF1931 family protein [Nonomuraea roseoviolacea]|uniref:DUF1931 family protein n=1 Tax=Nonomuraea roseoviolacea subsp. carminata TaxID=160689 RepID=A0ABT1K1T1_9ACTN|nr:DUF1931 family protein [Nonomuraea roseoviolacea]MCP2347572.1 hypothetical protein [Nonomuraea roseoviolacea subsp. carminata]